MVLAGIVQQQVGDYRADVEAHRTVVCEFGVDHFRRSSADEDAAGMQVAVKQRLPVRQELLAQQRDFEVQLPSVHSASASSLIAGSKLLFGESV